MNGDNGIEILLVEDNSQDGELALRALRKRNLANHLVWLKDGAEALEYVFGAPLSPKVILLDLKLPRVDGLEVLRQIKGDDRTRHIPVVALTSSREERDIVHSYRLGVNSYIVKPVDFEQFSEAVAQLGVYWLALNQPPEPVSEA